MATLFDFVGTCSRFGLVCRDAAGRVIINRNYGLFMGGSFVSAMGSWFQTVAIGWVVLELTGSPFYLGLTSFVQLMPVFFLGLIGGVLSDRVDRRKLLLAGVGTNAVAVSTLAALTLFGMVNLPSVLGLSLVLGLSNSVVWPAWQPFIKELVPEDRLREAIAFNSARFNVSRVLGPALAGVLLARVGAAACLLVAAGGMAGVLVATWLIRRPVPEHRAEAERSVLGALGDGFRYVRQDVFVGRLMLITGSFGLLVMPYQSFMPAFARDILGIGASGLGALLASVGAGAIAGALLSSTKFVSSRPGVCMAIAAAIAGVALASFAITPPPEPGRLAWLSYASLAFVGLGTTGYLTTSNATLQLRVPEELMGRIMGLWVVMNAGMMPLGSLMLGGVSERFGLPSVIFWCGLVGIGLGALALGTRAFAGSREQKGTNDVRPTTDGRRPDSGIGEERAAQDASEEDMDPAVRGGIRAGQLGGEWR
jgi:MFS family permease